MAVGLVAMGKDLLGKATPEAPAEQIALYERLLATNPAVKRKGAKSAYTSLNGHMFSFVDKTGTLSLRLPAEEREAFVEKYDTRISIQYGAVMKEYVDVPDDLMRRTSELKHYFDISFAYVGLLNPKPTKK